MHPSELSAEDYMIHNRMDVMRDAILENLSRLERAALFNDFEEFKQLYREEYYESLGTN
jgi:hypothetical protein